jgi:hypothetical protein
MAKATRVLSTPRRTASKAKPTPPVQQPATAQKEERARFRQEVRVRISLIATERGLPESETAKVMSYLRTRDVIAFIKQHHISADWLLCGDLKGLLDTVRGCPSRPQQPVLSPGDGGAA